MSRPNHRFRTEFAGLEGRLLLAAGHAPIRANDVQFQQLDYAKMSVLIPPNLIVGQQDGYATVVLERSDNLGVSQVRVTTDPSSPAVGVNVAPVDQTVTFQNLDSEAVVRIPLIAGAPNPGEVDVNLMLTPVTPRVTVSEPLELSIMASDATIAPKIVSVEGKSNAIVLTFNKPMDPATASDVGNYAVKWSAIHEKHGALGSLAILNPNWWYDSSTSSGTMPIKAARYDPATNSVALVAKKNIQYSRATGGITVTQAHPAAGSALTDLEGTPINADFGPGEFSELVFKGLKPAH